MRLYEAEVGLSLKIGLLPLWKLAIGGELSFVGCGPPTIDSSMLLPTMPLSPLPLVDLLLSCSWESSAFMRGAGDAYWPPLRAEILLKLS